jgi:hypothetical protein
MFVKIKIENKCLIVDLVSGEAVETKSGLYFANRYASEIDEIKIVSGNLRIRRGRNGCITDYTVVSKSSPVISPAISPVPSPQPEVEEIPFLPSPLLRLSVHVILDDDSRTPSPVAPPKKKRRKGKRNLKHD